MRLVFDNRFQFKSLRRIYASKPLLVFNFILDVKVNVLAEKDEVDGKYSLEEKTISSKLIL